MNLAQLSLPEQVLFVLAALTLFVSFVLLAQTRLTAAIHAFAWQGALVAAVAALVGWVSADPHLYLSAGLTLVLKALLIPWMLHHLVRRLDMDRERETLVHPALVALAGTGLVVFAYWLVLPLERLAVTDTRNLLAISLATVLLGFWMLVVRAQAVAQVLGFMSIENGLFLGAVAATRGMPLVVELGVAFDVLVARILFGVFFFQIRESIDSLDTDRLDHLAETEEEA